MFIENNSDPFSILMLWKKQREKKMSTSWVRFLYRILAWSTQIWLVTWQDRRIRGGRGGPAPIFGISVNPISTKCCRLCPTHYYWSPQIFGICPASAWWCNSAQIFVLAKSCPVTISRTFYVGIMPKPSAPRIPNKETRWLWSSTALCSVLEEHTTSEFFKNSSWNSKTSPLFQPFEICLNGLKQIFIKKTNYSSIRQNNIKMHFCAMHALCCILSMSRSIKLFIGFWWVVFGNNNRN